MTDFIKRVGTSSYEGKIALVCAHDDDALQAVSVAKKNKLADFVLVGIKKSIESIAKENNLDIEGIEIIDESDEKTSAEIAVKLVREKKCSALMKGLVQTALMMKAVLNKDNGLRTDRILSHVGFCMLKDGQEYFITDAAMNIEPNVEAKKCIIKNACDVANALGYEEPNVACLCAKEYYDEKMLATVHAKQLQELYLSGEITNCKVSGPLALDNAVSKEAAICKGITDPVAGNANILLCHDLDTANVLYKALIYMSESQTGSVIMGASCPIILTSRADSWDIKLNSIFLASKIASFRHL